MYLQDREAGVVVEVALSCPSKGKNYMTRQGYPLVQAMLIKANYFTNKRAEGCFFFNSLIPTAAVLQIWLLTWPC
jgi:hypothetical protein